MNHATRYRCFCGAERFLPERPDSPAHRVRAGCDTCESITTHRPAGHPAGWGDGA